MRQRRRAGTLPGIVKVVIGDLICSEISPEVIDLNVRFLMHVAKAFKVPIVLSSVGVEIGKVHPIRESITNELPGYKVLDRHTMNAWEDPHSNAL